MKLQILLVLAGTVLIIGGLIEADKLPHNPTLSNTLISLGILAHTIRLILYFKSLRRGK